MATESERGGATNEGFFLAFPPDIQPTTKPLKAFAIGFLVREYRDGKPVNPWIFATGKSGDTARKMKDRYDEMGLGDRLVIKVALYPDGSILPVELPRVHDGVERKKGCVYVEQWNLAGEIAKLEYKRISGLDKEDKAPPAPEKKK